jgi:hypothetical protein
VMDIARIVRWKYIFFNLFISFLAKVYKYTEIEDYNIDFILLLFQLKVEKKFKDVNYPHKVKLSH